MRQDHKVTGWLGMKKGDLNKPPFLNLFGAFPLYSCKTGYSKGKDFTGYRSGVSTNGRNKEKKVEKPLQLRDQEFRNNVMAAFGFKKETLEDFYQYWSEPSKSGTKMRWEMEKTWDLKRRLGRWLRNGKDEVKEVKTNGVPVTEIDKLDYFLKKYTEHPTVIPFEDFALWYDYLKEHRLLKIFTKGEVQEIAGVYEGNNLKCRAAVVQRTFDGYANSGITFKTIIQMRERLNQKV